MSQHQIQVNSPKIGLVLVTVGYDPMLDEAFLNYFNNDVSYMSPPGLAAGEIAKLVLEHLFPAIRELNLRSESQSLISESEHIGIIELTTRIPYAAIARPRASRLDPPLPACRRSGNSIQLLCSSPTTVRRD